MEGFKGFNPDFTCMNNKQYQENTTFEEESAEVCERGMHFCKNPFDVLDHYDFVNIAGDIPKLNQFAEVEALDEALTDDGRKYCTKKLKVGAKLTIAGLVKAFVGFTLEKINIDKCLKNTGYYSASTNTGDKSASIVEGKDSVAVAWGKDSIAKGSKGCYLVLAEYSKNGDVINAKMEYVDGKRIKEDTFYILKGGEFTEC